MPQSTYRLIDVALYKHRNINDVVFILVRKEGICSGYGVWVERGGIEARGRVGGFQVSEVARVEG